MLAFAGLSNGVVLTTVAGARLGQRQTVTPLGKEEIAGHREQPGPRIISGDVRDLPPRDRHRLGRDRVWIVAPRRRAYATISPRQAKTARNPVSASCLPAPCFMPSTVGILAERYSALADRVGRTSRSNQLRLVPGPLDAVRSPTRIVRELLPPGTLQTVIPGASVLQCCTYAFAPTRVKNASAGVSWSCARDMSPAASACSAARRCATASSGCDPISA